MKATISPGTQAGYFNSRLFQILLSCFTFKYSEMRIFYKTCRCYLFGAFLLASGSTLFADYSITSSNRSDVDLPDAGDWQRSSIQITGAPADAKVTKITVSCSYYAQDRGDVEIDLNSGQRSFSSFRPRGWVDIKDSLSGDYAGGTFSVTKSGITDFNGLSVNGTWYLSARDVFSLGVSEIKDWSIKIYYDKVDLDKPRPTGPGEENSEPGEMISDIRPTLRWREVDGADRYAIFMSEKRGSDWVRIDGDSWFSSSTSFRVPSGKLSPGNRYRWNLLALD